MRTEVVIPFTFDTTPIEQMMQENAEQEVTRIITELVEEKVNAVLPVKNEGFGVTRKVPDWREFLEQSFGIWLDEHQKEIIDEAALLLAAKAGRKKAWREVLKEMQDEGEGRG
jgi:hypothetical protein